MTWIQVAEKLKLSRGMLMMVLRGDRRLSAKALFRFEETEQEVVERRSTTERIVEGLIDRDDLVAKVTGRGQSRRKSVQLAVEYKIIRTVRKLPTNLSLTVPGDEECRKLRYLFGATLDTKVIALSCLPREFRSEAFIAQLTVESRARLTHTALDLVIPDWRTMVNGGDEAPTEPN
jgi:hypothetical protein